jgi:hypothetical protein
MNNENSSFHDPVQTKAEKFKKYYDDSGLHAVQELQFFVYCKPQVSRQVK